MHCIKTGFYANLFDGNQFLYGDAFILEALGNPPVAEHLYATDKSFRGDDHLLLRICAACSDSEGAKVNISIQNYEHWFDELRAKDTSNNGILSRVWIPNSTMIVAPGNWHWLGYNGQPAGSVAA